MMDYQHVLSNPDQDIDGIGGLNTWSDSGHIIGIAVH